MTYCNMEIIYPNGRSVVLEGIEETKNELMHVLFFFPDDDTQIRVNELKHIRIPAIFKEKCIFVITEYEE